MKPKLSRREQIAMDCFHQLNRDRDYLVLPSQLKCLNIKRLDIINYHAKLTVPISCDILIKMIQEMDDAFITYNDDLAKAESETK